MPTAKQLAHARSERLLQEEVADPMTSMADIMKDLINTMRVPADMLYSTEGKTVKEALDILKKNGRLAQR